MPQFRLAYADSVKPKTGKISELFVYDNFNRVPAERVEAGDICAFTGLSDVGIGETVCPRDSPAALPTIEVTCRLGLAPRVASGLCIGVPPSGMCICYHSCLANATCKCTCC